MEIYLGLGSNLGDRRDHLARSLTLLPTHGVQVLRVSPVVESPAMLPDEAPADWNQPFLNLVVSCSTERSPDEVLYVWGWSDDGKFIRVRTAPAGSTARNPAFDVTPAELVTAIITERGIVPATVEGIRSVARG